jgi:hypothetical protein
MCAKAKSIHPRLYLTDFFSTVFVHCFLHHSQLEPRNRALTPGPNSIQVLRGGPFAAILCRRKLLRGTRSSRLSEAMTLVG